MLEKGPKFCFIFRNQTESGVFSNRAEANEILTRMCLNNSVRAQEDVMNAWKDKNRDIPFLATQEDIERLRNELDQLLPPGQR